MGACDTRGQGDGSVQSQLEVQQIDTFDTSDTFGSGAAGTGTGIDYASQVNAVQALSPLTSPIF